MILIYRDCFKSGGVPSEIRNFTRAFSKHKHINIFSEKGLTINNFENIENIKVNYYSNVVELACKLNKVLSEGSKTPVISVGFFMIETIIASIISRLNTVEFILWPIAQAMKVSMTGKVFSYYPGLESLDNKKNQNFLYRLKYDLSKRLSRLYKQLYKLTFGNMIDKNTTYVGCLSKQEYKEYKELFPRTNTVAINMKWGMDIVEKKHSNENFYESIDENKTINIIYWGRLEWHYKGLDRIIEGARAAKSIINTSKINIPFKIYFCGPDYNQGRNKLENEIIKKKVSDIVKIIEKEDYETGTNDPLFYADASILLPRWDGLPRTLRESLILGVPIIVSKETHLKEFVSHEFCGVYIENPDDPICIANAIISICDNKLIREMKKNSLLISRKITWDKIALDFINDLKSSSPKRMTV